MTCPFLVYFFKNMEQKFLSPNGKFQSYREFSLFLDYSWWGTAVLKIEFSLWLSFYPAGNAASKKQKLYNLMAVMLEMNRMD